MEFTAGRQVSEIDILHIEEHGNAVLSETGDVPATTMGETFRQAKMALLWSCYSGAADSWGVSPALCLHRNGVGMVLSFLAELHYDDAGSIAEAFYADVFGAAASRDPESALLRIRCAKVATEFAFANWASMTVYLRNPLDLTALPLNGPRVPAAGWLASSDDATDTFWNDVAAEVSRLQSGAQDELDASGATYAKLPLSAFKAWRGNVIRIDESAGMLADDATLRELGLATENAPATDAADRLVWFFTQIARFGAPLIVWSNAAARHVEFVQTVQPSASLTFLFLHGPKSEPSEPDRAGGGESTAAGVGRMPRSIGRLRRREPPCRLLRKRPGRAAGAGQAIHLARQEAAGTPAADGEFRRTVSGDSSRRQPSGIHRPHGAR